MTHPSPSGRQVELSFGEQRATVTEVGASLREYVVGRQPVLDGYAVDEMCSSGRGQLLVPWPNRTQDGRYAIGGRDHQLPINEPARQNAIHGLVRWVPWIVREHVDERAVLAFELHPQPGYPFALALEVEYALAADGLRATLTATNVGSEACPYGFGSHPYLTVGTGTVDEVALRVPARTVLRADERGIPAEAAPVAGTEFDFLEPRPIGGLVLDHCFTDLVRDDDGVARVELTAPGGNPHVTLWMDSACEYVMVFTGDPLPDVARRSLAVEPMSCAPDAFRSGAGLVTLEPGAAITGAWGVSFSGP